MSDVARKPVETFICYTSRDKSWYEQLVNHLSVLQEQHVLVLKDRREIGLRAEWRQQIHPGIRSAQLILLLLNQEFITSGYLSDNEMQQALERYERGEVHIAVILLRPALWRENAILRHLPFLLDQKEPLSTRDNKIEVFEEIAKGIAQICQELPAHKLSLEQTTPVDKKNLEPSHEDENIQQPIKKTSSKVFVYYSHEDVLWLNRLQTHLKPLEHAGELELWDDTKIAPGSKWREEIQNAIETSAAIVLLVSANFLASEFIYTHELPRILARAEASGTTILPVIVSPCMFNESKLEIFRSINSPEHSLTTMSFAEQETTLTRLARVIRNIAQRKQAN